MYVTIDQRFEQLIPPLTDDERRRLYQQLDAEGMRDSFKVWVLDADHVILLDGYTRYQWYKERGRTEPLKFAKVDGIDNEQGAKRWIISNQLARRNLSQEQKRQLIAEYLKLNPEQSDRQVAAAVGVDHKTVGSVRAKREATGEIPHFDKTRGKDGKARTTTPKASNPAASELEQTYNQDAPWRKARSFRETMDLIGPPKVSKEEDLATVCARGEQDPILERILLTIANRCN